MMGKQKQIKITTIILLLFLLNNIASAQVKAFRYKADINKIYSNGVYLIELSPDLIAKSKKDLSDIRLLDNNGKSVAFALSSNLSLNYPDSFIPFPQVVKLNPADTTAFFIAENKNLVITNELWIKLKKTEVKRTLNLSGSDDLLHWYAIKENFELEEATNGNETSYQQQLNFPNNNYRYFKIAINGKNRIPVKILQAGVYSANLNKPVYIDLPPATLEKNDTGKISHISISFKSAFLINKVHFTITAPKFYSRRIVVYDIQSNKANQLTDTTITSAGLSDVFISAKTYKLRVDIFNGDDNPLQLKSIDAFQVKEYAISYLENGHRYSILTGNSLSKSPSYDLSFLDHIIYSQLNSITHTVIYKNPDYQMGLNTHYSNHTVWLWSAIVFVLLVLSFLTFRMVKELN